MASLQNLIPDPTTKNLELTPEQRALKTELREYFTGLADANEHRDTSRVNHTIFFMGPHHKSHWDLLYLDCK